ncbi:hypothetical protein CMO93_02680 [Candidatus Woesearchaeota archaeon]|nr:hypothetical protein [Candidatus Woesearchaeota archaeon]|tara:strand:- start:589 stop:2865 length:2277 start_codon:yes stop_codon:yes gene_type:complete
MKPKLILIILLILLVPVVQGNGEFENYLKLENPTINDFNDLKPEDQHKVYSDKNNIRRCSECDDAYFGGKNSGLNMQRNPEAAKVYISNLAGMDVDISPSLGQVAVVDGVVINPPGSSLIKNLAGVKAVANKEGGFTYIKSGKTIKVVGNEETNIEFKDNSVVTGSGAKIDLSDVTSIKIDDKENTIISINQNKIKFGKDAKFDLTGNKLSMGKNVVGHIKKGDDWANFRTFDRTEAVFGTNGNYAMNGNFFYSGKNEIGSITVPTILEASLRKKEIEKGLKLIDGERNPISLCVGDCKEFETFLDKNQVLISDNQVRVKAFGSVDVFDKDEEILSLVGQHEKADFVIERDQDNKLFITQKNTPPITEETFEAEVKTKHEERIDDLTNRRENLQEVITKETDPQAKTKLQNQIKEVDRLIKREQDKYDAGDASKNIDYGLISYSKKDTLIIGNIGARQYVGADYEKRDFYPITTELHQLSYQHSTLGEKEKYFTIITESNDPQFQTRTEAYEGYTIMDVTAGEMKLTGSLGEDITGRGRNLKGNVDYYTLTKTFTTEKRNEIGVSLILNPRGAIERTTTLDSSEFEALKIGKVTITPSMSTADLDFTKIPSAPVTPSGRIGAQIKEEAAKELRDIFSKASFKNPEDIGKGFKSLGLGPELTNSLIKRAPEIINRVITDPKLDGGIYRMNIVQFGIGGDSTQVIITFEPSNKKPYMTILRGSNYGENYKIVRDKLTSEDIPEQARAELNKQKEGLLKYP